MIHLKQKYTYATLITCGRLLCVVPVISAIAIQQWTMAFCFFIFAAATDGIDGFVARRFNECTFFGAALDACVDKIMIVSTLFSLVIFNHATFAIPFWFLVAISIKEIAQLMGAIYIYFYIHHFEIKPLLLGKCTMALYVILITVFLYMYIKKIPFYGVQYCCAFVAFVAYASFYQYFIVAYCYINEYQNRK
ncbi:hypothetical protein EKK58_02770 [Candidatus Dependentiae bacterium]|nr:MAG: hypothetical protein EKK58_02770 [Candidatus Dependentiae bacterium]